LQTLYDQNGEDGLSFSILERLPSSEKELRTRIESAWIAWFQSLYGLTNTENWPRVTAKD
jgi:hypothetical protein